MTSQALSASPPGSPARPAQVWGPASGLLLVKGAHLVVDAVARYVVLTPPNLTPNHRCCLSIRFHRRGKYFHERTGRGEQARNQAQAYDTVRRISGDKVAACSRAKESSVGITLGLLGLASYSCV